ncbi:hypothetical protein BASA61_007588 [Batrachochytrium salamandrivorans]|nr:hypothetical protein BASA62_006322 [Batrachochytrium salamandrivorans]KAH6582842.1 hypothetical protein BASA60_001738 [Batrachochytrium salamandrivorans]KAH6584230.1 hypothetical protein BASA61_007588 [Batrachochytrium salamandrivorans]
MCRMVQCSKCTKPTWAGCGMHIETALAGVPVESRCACSRAVESSSDRIHFKATVPLTSTNSAIGSPVGVKEHHSCEIQ